MRTTSTYIASVVASLALLAGSVCWAATVRQTSYETMRQAPLAPGDAAYVSEGGSASMYIGSSYGPLRVSDPAALRGSRLVSIPPGAFSVEPGDNCKTRNLGWGPVAYGSYEPFQLVVRSLGAGDIVSVRWRARFSEADHDDDSVVDVQTVYNGPVATLTVQPRTSDHEVTIYAIQPMVRPAGDVDAVNDLTATRFRLKDPLGEFEFAGLRRWILDQASWRRELTDMAVYGNVTGLHVGQYDTGLSAILYPEPPGENELLAWRTRAPVDVFGTIRVYCDSTRIWWMTTDIGSSNGDPDETLPAEGYDVSDLRPPWGTTIGAYGWYWFSIDTITVTGNTGDRLATTNDVADAVKSGLSGYATTNDVAAAVDSLRDTDMVAMSNGVVTAISNYADSVDTRLSDLVDRADYTYSWMNEANECMTGWFSYLQWYATNNFAAVQRANDNMTGWFSYLQWYATNNFAAVQRANNNMASRFNYLQWFATNNFAAARKANVRAWELERRLYNMAYWRYTNAVTRSDIAAGVTAWAVTPIHPVGRVVVAQVDTGEVDIGKWSLFRTNAVEHSAATALVPPVAGPDDAVDLDWPDASWQYTSEGVTITTNINISASRMRLPSVSMITDGLALKADRDSPYIRSSLNVRYEGPGGRPLLGGSTATLTPEYLGFATAQATGARYGRNSIIAPGSVELTFPDAGGVTATREWVTNSAGLLPSDFTSLTNNPAFTNAVVAVSPPAVVDIPEGVLSTNVDGSLDSGLAMSGSLSVGGDIEANAVISYGGVSVDGGALTVGDTDVMTELASKASASDLAAVSDAVGAITNSTVVSIGLESEVQPPTSTFGLKRAVAIGYRAATTGAAPDGNSQGVAVGAHSKAGEASVAVGSQANADTNEAVAVGYTAVATGKWSVAVGRIARAFGQDAVALGYGARATNVHGVAVGNAVAGGGYTVAAGYGASALNAEAVAIGPSAKASGARAIAVGSAAQATFSRAVAIGEGANATKDGATALGRGGKAYGTASVAVGGNFVNAGGNDPVAKLSAEAAGNYSTALGQGAVTIVGANEAMQLGRGTNRVAKTLQFRDYPLVDANGYIPTNRLTNVVSTLDLASLSSEQLDTLRALLGVADDTMYGVDSCVTVPIMLNDYGPDEGGGSASSSALGGGRASAKAASGSGPRYTGVVMKSSKRNWEDGSADQSFYVDSNLQALGGGTGPMQFYTPGGNGGNPRSLQAMTQASWVSGPGTVVGVMRPAFLDDLSVVHDFDNQSFVYLRTYEGGVETDDSGNPVWRSTSATFHRHHPDWTYLGDAVGPGYTYKEDNVVYRLHTGSGTHDVRFEDLPPYLQDRITQDLSADVIYAEYPPPRGGIYVKDPPQWLVDDLHLQPGQAIACLGRLPNGATRYYVTEDPKAKRAAEEVARCLAKMEESRHVLAYPVHLPGTPNWVRDIMRHNGTPLLLYGADGEAQNRNEWAKQNGYSYRLDYADPSTKHFTGGLDLTLAEYQERIGKLVSVLAVSDAFTALDENNPVSPAAASSLRQPKPSTRRKQQ